METRQQTNNTVVGAVVIIVAVLVALVAFGAAKVYDKTPTNITGTGSELFCRSWRAMPAVEHVDADTRFFLSSLHEVPTEELRSLGVEIAEAGSNEAAMPLAQRFDSLAAPYCD
jgi:hypothetical protein